MKKLFVSCMIAFMAICSVGAQEVYIGGGFTVGSEDSEFVFQISPEVGCHLTDQWAVGGEIGYTHYDDYNRFQFAPYARYTFYKTGIVGLFVDGTIGIAAGDGDTGFRLGLRPGLSLCLVLILVDCVLKKSCYRLSINVKKTDNPFLILK